MVDWANTVIALAGLFIAIVAIFQTRRSSRTANEANEISRGANELASKANRYAEQALELQEDESQVRLIVKPSMVSIMSKDGNPEEDHQPRPMVEVINLSAFPVTIKAIHWKAAEQFFYWNNPTIANPFATLPARLPSRESLTAIGNPTSFKNLSDLASITGAIVYTACGEKVEGMTDNWKTAVAQMLAERRT